MNAQTEQLIYWKQRHDKLAEQHAKAVEALRQAVREATELSPQRYPLSGVTIKKMQAVLSAIDKESTDA